MRRLPLLVAFSIAGATGCAAITPTRGRDEGAQLAQGVAALEARDYDRARSLLEPLYFQHWREPVGQQALLTLAAAELDGRNPDRRLSAAADMAGRLLQIPELEPWMVPLGESLYLIAEEMGAAEDRALQADSAGVDAEARAARAEATAGYSRTLPSSGREPVPRQLARLRDERDELKRQLEEREQQVAMRDRELRDTKQELERIKKTIKP